MTFSETVEKLIGEYRRGTAPVEAQIGVVMAREHLLPVWLDMGGCYALRPSGEVVSFGWDDEVVSREEDPRIRNIAFAEGARRYAELLPFVPHRPPNAPDCEVCGGTGTPLSLPAHLVSRIVCQCGGLGWLPE